MNKIKKKNSFINGMRKNGPGDYTVRARVRVPGGKIVEKRDGVKTKEEGKKRIEEMKAEIRLENRMDLGNHLSTVKCKTFLDLAEYYERKNPGLSRNSYLKTLKIDLGGVPKKEIYQRFVGYQELLQNEKSPRTGKLRSNKTINHYSEAVSAVMGFCSKKRHQLYTGVKKNPFKDYEMLDTSGRDRVFHGCERDNLEKLMRQKESKLLYAFLFSEINPIRQGDLVDLKRSNIEFIKSKMIVKYKAKKTKKNVDKPTFLLWIPNEIKEYWNTLPPECPWLFPVKNEDGSYRPMKRHDFARHWYALLKEANIEDFRWHDLKHVSITYLRDVIKLSRDYIKKLGLQFSDKMIDLYYHDDAEKTINMYLAEHPEYEAA